jgi:predicted small lipoprotein YifL
MIQIMKRINLRSLVFLLLIAIAATGLSGALSFAAPAAGQANNNKARTKAPQRDGTSPTQRVGDKCKRKCTEDWRDCLHVNGKKGGASVWGAQVTCGSWREECLRDCESGAKPPTKQRKPPTPRGPRT